MLIEQIHLDIIHQGKDKIKDKFDQLKIFYHGINFDIEKISHLFDICIPKK